MKIFTLADLILIAIVAVLVLTWEPLAFSGPKVAPNNVFKATITRVSDGDTMDALVQPIQTAKGFRVMIERRLRLARVNTPELTSLNPIEKANALKAKSFVTDLLLGRDVLVQLGKPDTYERNVAEVYYTDETKNQINLSDLLLSKGLAVLYKGGK